MGFGFGVGDFLAVIELANSIRSRFVNAPDQFKAIYIEVKSLSNVLRDIDDILLQRDLSDQQKTELGEIVKGCRGVLEDLEKTLDKYQELDPTTKGFTGRSRRVWKRLRWDQSDIDGFRSRVTSNVSMLNVFVERISSKAVFETKENVDQLISHQHDQDRKAILNWLTPVDYAQQQSDFISIRQQGTGQWLLTSNEFRAWMDQSDQILFCPGIPGAGKTISTAIVIDELNNKFQNNLNVAIAYVYCNFRRQDEQKAIDLLTNLLRQLVWRQDSVPQSIQQLYKKHLQQRTRPSIDVISQAFQSLVAIYSRTFIVIDALDECQVKNGERNRFLAELLGLKSKTAFNLFATSRFIPEIKNEFNGSIKLEILANKEDLSSYINDRIKMLPKFVSRNKELQEDIKTTIIKAVDGMFLLAQLHFDSLIGKSSPKAIRNALERLPKGSNAYDHAYHDAMDRIEGQVHDSEHLAKKALSWITCAKRPLTTLELQHALGVEIDEPELDPDNLPDIEDMVSVCAGLVIVDEQSNIIRLVHYTTQEFLERTRSHWFPDAEAHIGNICISYLSFDAFASGFCQSDAELETRLQSNPLYDYAARNWGHHIRESSSHDQNIGFLEDAAKVAASSQVLMVNKEYPYPDYSQGVPKEMRGIHLAAWFGLTEIVNFLIEKGHVLDCKDNNSRTPLSYAAENGHKAVVELLVEKGTEPDSKDKGGRTPLSHAAGRGHEAVVKLLLEKGTEPDSKDKYGQTPLSHAAGRGHEAVVKLLLEKGTEPDSKDKYSQTPLSWAAEEGHEAVVKLLLEKDTELGSKDEDGRTPLSWAAEEGHEAVVKLLLEKGAEPDSKDKYGRTPLSWAAGRGHEAIVKLLLEKGAELGSKDEDGQTPLSWAAAEGHEAVVELLLEKGAELDSKGEDGQTPLSHAAAEGHEAVVKLLLEKGTELDSKDEEYGQTPLSWAAEEGHEAVVKLLLEKGAEPDSKDKYSQTPLSWAAGRGHEAIVKLLLEKGAELGSKDEDGQTPLSWAAEEGHEAVVELLLEKGAELDSKDEDGQTPLSHAAARGHEAVVKLLLEKGAEPDSKDKYSQTPLSHAAGRGHEAVVKLLLEKGTEPDAKDEDGRTPLSHAAARGHEAVGKLLSSTTLT